MEQVISKRIYDNIAFWKRFVSICFYDLEECGSLFAGKSVRSEALKIFRVEGNDLVEVDI